MNELLETVDAIKRKSQVSADEIKFLIYTIKRLWYIAEDLEAGFSASLTTNPKMEPIEDALRASYELKRLKDGDNSEE